MIVFEWIFVHYLLFERKLIRFTFLQNSTYFITLTPRKSGILLKETVSIPDMKKEKFLSIRGGFEKIIREELLKYDISPDVAYYFDEDSSIIAMVAAGFGITLMPSLLTRHIDFNLKIKKLSWLFYRQIGIVKLKQKHQLWAQKKFIEFLKEKSEEINM